MGRATNGAGVVQEDGLRVAKRCVASDIGPFVSFFASGDGRGGRSPQPTDQALLGSGVTADYCPKRTARRLARRRVFYLRTSPGSRHWSP